MNDNNGGVVIYTRFSPRKEADLCKSSQLQTVLCRRWAESQERPVIGVYDDAERSGKTMTGRTGLEGALAAACREKATLCVYKLDRLARSLRDLLNIVDRLKRDGAHIASVSESFDSGTPQGRLLFHILGVMGEFEREVTSERTRVAMRSLQRQGRVVGGHAPYGWEVDPASAKLPGRKSPSQLRPVAEEQHALAQMFRLHGAGLSYREIARWLDTQGLASRGKKWHHSTVKRALARSGESQPART